MPMRYKSPEALRMAVNAVARKSDTDTSRAVTQFYIDRLLCRVFADEQPAFVLKGGQSLIVRIPDARTTRDVDLLALALDADQALNLLRKAAARNLGDFISFEYEGAKEIKADEEYRSGYAVTFVPYMGMKRNAPISIDLVVDKAFAGVPEKLAPPSRLAIDGLVSYDYLLYPVAEALADKLCAMAQLYQGRESSRVKDLVDAALLLTTDVFSADELLTLLKREVRLRGITSLGDVHVPTGWLGNPVAASKYRTLAKGTSLAGEYASLEEAASLVESALTLLLAGEAVGKSWNPALLRWE